MPAWSFAIQNKLSWKAGCSRCARFGETLHDKSEGRAGAIVNKSIYLITYVSPSRDDHEFDGLPGRRFCVPIVACLQQGV